MLIGVPRKNRRDGATVSTRVLAMSDLAGSKLLQSAASSQQAAEGDVDVSTRKMRRKDITTNSRL